MKDFTYFQVQCDPISLTDRITFVDRFLRLYL